MSIEICNRDEELFPKRLKRIAKAPGRLFYKGNIGIVNEMPCVAVIGTRDVSGNGQEKAYVFGRIAAEEGFVVVNGLAVGCDTMALKGALSVDGKCAVILPSGLDEIYPKSNEGLAREILEKGGCLISEYDPGEKPQTHYFIERDRLQSGVSLGVIVVETGTKGGTMHTVRYAGRQGKRLACYYSRLMENAAGNQDIVDRGIGVAIESVEELRRFLQEIKAVGNEVYEQLEFRF